MQRVALKIGRKNLLRKSIILIKSWMTYESSLLGSHAANMATYALYIIVIFLLNNFYDELQSPLDVFRKYFDYFGSETKNFDWENRMLTIFGPVKTLNFSERIKNEGGYDIDKLALIDRETDPQLADRPLLFKPEDLYDQQIRYATVRLLSSHSLSHQTLNSLD